jgi:hypothetical protein
VCLLDHDDRWMPIKLERQVAFATANAYDIVSTGAIAVWERTRKSYSQFYPEEFMDKLDRSSTDPAIDMFELLIRHNFMWASSVMVKRTLFERFGVFNPAVAPADDYDMWLRCMPEARIGFLGESLIEYSIHAGNASHNFTRMVEKTILVLHAAADRHPTDRRRLAQFEGSLIANYRILLTELIEQRRYGPAFRRAASLVARQRRGLRLLYHVADHSLLTALRKSFGGKRTTPRSVYGEQHLEVMRIVDDD